MDEITLEQMEEVMSMIRTGQRHGLVHELLWSYSNAIAAGDSVIDAVTYAYDEWDC